MKPQQPHITNFLLVVIMLLLSRPTLFADIIVDGEVHRSFRIDNTSDFPDYNFFYRYQSYDLDGGTLEPAGIVEKPVEEGIVYQTELGSEAIVIARPVSGVGEDIVASRTLGGKEPTSSKDLHDITDVVKIVSLSEEAFSIRVTQYIRNFDDGTKQVIASNRVREMVSMLNPTRLSSTQILLGVMLPIVIIVGLFLYQIKRRRKESANSIGRVVSLKKRVIISGTDPVVSE